MRKNNDLFRYEDSGATPAPFLKNIKENESEKEDSWHNLKRKRKKINTAKLTLNSDWKYSLKAAAT